MLAAMENFVDVRVDASRFPGRARAAYRESFRLRQMNHQFHYDTETQAQQWLALHEAYSPARTDPQCHEMYLTAFYQIAESLPPGPKALISIGCGGGQKDVALLNSLQCERYIPADVSLALALTAHRAASIRGVRSTPVVLDLTATESLTTLVTPFLETESNRLLAFFGMMPNFEPDEALLPLAGTMRAGDHLVLSANLAPGPDYRKGVERILPLYANELTRRWLTSVVADAGINVKSDDLEFRIEQVPGEPALLRIESGFHLRQDQRIYIDGEEFDYEAGEWFRLFFSYRYTPQMLQQVLGAFGIEIIRQWIAQSGEEGVFLCRKRAT
jgi:L-histidine N-alpha-methyltransferase